MLNLSVKTIIVMIAAMSAVIGNDNYPIRVSASIAPLAFVAQEIGGNHVTASFLIPEDAAPETFALTPRQVIDFVSSDLFIKVGHPRFNFEKNNLNPLVKDNPDIIMISAWETDIAPERENNGGHSHSGDATDPHIWLSPQNIIYTARQVKTALSRYDPENSAEYQANLINFIGRIDSLSGIIRARLKECNRNTFLIFHPVWGHFAAYFGLQQIAIESDGKEPGPGQIRKLIDLALDKGISVIFIQKGFSQISVKIIAQEAGCRIVELNPLAYNWLENLERTSILFSEALNE